MLRFVLYEYVPARAYQGCMSRQSKIPTNAKEWHILGCRLFRSLSVEEKDGTNDWRECLEYFTQTSKC